MCFKVKSLLKRKFFDDFLFRGGYYQYMSTIIMQTITFQSIKAESHPQIKGMFWYLFVGTRGGQNRVRIISQLRNKPSNKHQISKDLNLEYKGIEHHINTLEKNNLVQKIGSKYGATYFVSALFEENESVFDEIVTKLMKVGGDEWLK